MTLFIKINLKHTQMVALSQSVYSIFFVSNLQLILTNMLLTFIFKIRFSLDSYCSLYSEFTQFLTFSVLLTITFSSATLSTTPFVGLGCSSHACIISNATRILMLAGILMVGWVKQALAVLGNDTQNFYRQGILMQQDIPQSTSLKSEGGPCQSP